MAAPRTGAIPARLVLAIGLAGALALGLIAALSPAPAQAGCPICDQYTLDIPDPTNGGHGGGSFDAGSEPTPEPAAATPTPAVTSAPSTTVPVTPAPTSSDDSSDRKPKRDDAPPAEPFMPVRVDGPPEQAATLTSVPLSYEGEDSAPGAALAGLGNPGTIALLAALIAAGAAVAVGRRRAPAT